MTAWSGSESEVVGGASRGSSGGKVNTGVTKPGNSSLGLAVPGDHPGGERAGALSHQRAAAVSTLGRGGGGGRLVPARCGGEYTGGGGAGRLVPGLDE